MLQQFQDAAKANETQLRLMNERLRLAEQALVASQGRADNEANTVRLVKDEATQQIAEIKRAADESARAMRDSAAARELGLSKSLAHQQATADANLAAAKEAAKSQHEANDRQMHQVLQHISQLTSEVAQMKSSMGASKQIPSSSSSNISATGPLVPNRPGDVKKDPWLVTDPWQLKTSVTTALPPHPPPPPPPDRGHGGGAGNSERGRASGAEHVELNAPAAQRFNPQGGGVIWLVTILLR